MQFVLFKYCLTSISSCTVHQLRADLQVDANIDWLASWYEVWGVLEEF